VQSHTDFILTLHHHSLNMTCMDKVLYIKRAPVPSAYAYV